jgi:hypothetical protein
MKIIGFILVSLIIFNLAEVCFSQNDDMTFTTYYPAPFGVYKQLILYPEPTDGVEQAEQPCSDEGEMYYDSDDNQVLYCYESAFGLIWRSLGGGSYWTLLDNAPPAPDCLYTNDSVTTEDWNVGSGTTTPAAKLHAQDGAMLIYCNNFVFCWPPPCPICDGTTPLSGVGGTRLMWIPAKGAFRAGKVDLAPPFSAGSVWDDAKIGFYSFATGNNTEARGDSWTSGMVAMGYDNYNQTLVAKFGAHASGATAIGQNAGAVGEGSLAIGSRVLANGRFSTAIGKADNDKILTAGLNPDDNYSTALGFASHEDGPFGALGYGSLSVGQNSKAEGKYSIAIGQRARAPYDRSAVINIENTVYPNFCQADAEGQLKICGELNVLGTLIAEVTIEAETCTGTCIKFRIPHPDTTKPKGTYLKHSAVEAPTAGDNLYRWTIEVKDKTAEINLPEYYKFLNKDDMVLVFPKGHFGRAYGKLDEKQQTLTIYANSDGEYNVILIGTRKDEAAEKYWQGAEVYEPSG